MTLLTTLDRYIARHLLITISLTLLALAGLGFITLFMGKLGDVGKADFGYLTLLAYVLLSLPQQIYEIFPAAALVGSSAGLSILALSSELTAMRAAGVSLYRIVFSVFKLCLALIVLVVLLGEWVVPAALETAEKLRAQALHKPIRSRVGSLWLRAEDQFIYIKEVLPDRSLRGISIIEPVSTEGGYKQIVADRADYRHGQWTLTGVRQTITDGKEVHAIRLPEQAWSPGFGPDLMEAMQAPKQTMSSLELWGYIQHLNNNQQDAAIYELSLWKKIVAPFSTLIMVMLAIPFVFGSVRTGGLGKRVFIGVMIGFFFSLLQSGMGYYSLSFNIAPAVAALAPTVLFLALTIYLFYRAVKVS